MWDSADDCWWFHWCWPYGAVWWSFIRPIWWLCNGLYWSNWWCCWAGCWWCINGMSNSSSPNDGVWNVWERKRVMLIRSVAICWSHLCPKSYKNNLSRLEVTFNNIQLLISIFVLLSFLHTLWGIVKFSVIFSRPNDDWILLGARRGPYWVSPDNFLSSTLMKKSFLNKVSLRGKFFITRFVWLNQTTLIWCSLAN